jgi:hypothetical protein
MALIGQPPTNQIADQQGNVTPGWQPMFSAAIQILQALTLSGTTANRPTKFIWVGRPYFDTTIGKPIWAKSWAAGTTSWVDATGGAV